MNNITRDDVAAFKVVAENSEHNTINFYQHIATKSAIYPGQGTPLGLAYVALKLNGEAGEFAEHVGKALRDDGLMLGVICHTDGSVSGRGIMPTDERRNLLIKEASDVLWYLPAIANEPGLSLSEIALANLEKLCDRSERNTLRGSGDER